MIMFVLLFCLYIGLIMMIFGDFYGPPIICASIIVFALISIWLLRKSKRKNNSNTNAAEILVTDEEHKAQEFDEYSTAEESRIDVDSMSGPDFERFCADLLRIHGYTDIYLTPASGDHGIDITAEKDSLKWGFQCKRWSDTKVDNTTVAQTYTGKALYECDIVAIITTSGFTRQAESEAKQLGVKLWGRNRVKELMQKLEDRERYYFSRVA